MARRSVEIEQLAADRRRVFAKYGVILAEDVTDANHNVPTTVLFNLMTDAKAVGPKAAIELQNCLFEIELWVLRTNYQGTICMYPYKELI